MYNNQDSRSASVTTIGLPGPPKPPLSAAWSFAMSVFCDAVAEDAAPCPARTAWASFWLGVDAT